MYVRYVVEADVLEGLAVAPAGPELSAALNALDLAQVPGDRVVEVLRAQARQCAHEQARLWATLVEVGLADPVDGPAGATSCDGLTERPGSVADWAAADEAAVACARVDRLAEAAKRAGHPARVGQIAADVFLGMLDGRFHGRSEDQIVAVLLRESRPENRPDDTRAVDLRPGDAARDGGRSNEDTGAEDTGTTEPVTDDVGACTNVLPIDNPATDESSADEPPTDEPSSNEPSTDEPSTDEPSSDEPSSDEASSDEAGADELARVGIEVRVGLTTLLGLDERPGEIPGLGPILAPVARAVVNRQLRGAEWRFAVTDGEGHLLLAGVTRHRPSSLLAIAQSAGRCRGGIVELQVSAAQLDRLAEGLVPGWAGVVTDIAAQYVGRHAVLAGLDERPYDRFPAAALARHIQVRDRTCSHPGCRRPARRCDLDHTRDHARGGTTVRENLGPGCARHHLFKHELGWRLAQPSPGIFEWTSPLGQVYRTRGEPISPPLPEPLPRPVEPPETSGCWYEGPILLRPDSPSRTEARPPPADLHEPPPF